jgi:hypothetical protein
MMRLRIQKSLIVLILLGLFLYGCVDEPYIEPVKRPFSVIRVGNFTSNLDPLTVLIDGKKIGDLAQNTVTKYFDVKSGQRSFTLKDANGNTVYNKDIPVISYEEETILFSGYYSTADTANTFGFFRYTDGLTYIEEIPPADTAYIYIINNITDTPTEVAKKISAFEIAYKDTVADTVATHEGIGYGTKVAYKTAAGTYTFSFFGEDSTSAELKDVQIKSQKRYYFFVSGTPKNYVVVKDEENPLPARSK